MKAPRCGKPVREYFRFRRSVIPGYSRIRCGRPAGHMPPCQSEEAVAYHKQEVLAKREIYGRTDRKPKQMIWLWAGC